MSATTETTTPATEPNNEPTMEPTMLINNLFQERDGIFAKATDAFKTAVENNGICEDRGNRGDFVFTIPACSM